MTPTELDCTSARVALSARLDGELDDERALGRHLSGCAECRDHDHALRELTLRWGVLREPAPRTERSNASECADLWTRIERGVHPPSTGSRALPRIAAGLIGFLGLGGLAVVLEQRAEPANPMNSSTPSSHLVERLASPRSASLAFLASLPDYQLLRRLPAEEDLR